MDKFSKACLAAIAVLLAVIALQNGLKSRVVSAAVVRTYEYSTVDLNRKAGTAGCGQFDLGQANANGQRGWQIVGVVSGAYGGGNGAATYPCYFAIEQH